MRIGSDTESTALARRMVALYLVGVNSIRFQPEGDRLLPRQRNAIKEIARSKLVGTEILADSNQEMHLQVLLSYPELSVDTALRRMTTIAASMRTDSVISLKELNRDLAQETKAIDDEVDRFSLYVIRQLKSAVRDPKVLAEIGLRSAVDCLGFRLITKSVERVADHAVKICDSALVLKDPLEPKLISRIEEMSEFSGAVFDKATSALFRKDYELADSVLARAEGMRQLEHGALSLLSRLRVDAVVAPQVRLVIESLKRISEYGADIAEVVLNLTISDYLKTQPRHVKKPSEN